ncbi:MAG TPA: integrase core domain-containing protein [Thermoanaerobaculia bacterium]|nr:integrase core domain-containing protein [Thermoanaerobaculia bacterium]
MKPRQKRRAIAHPGKAKIAPITRPNQLQNIDYKGEFRTGDGRWCYPLTLTDTFSRKLLICRAFHAINFDNTRGELEAYFREHGIPDAIRMDNGNPFVISRSLAGLSRLGVWLIKLGVERIRTRPGSPQDNGLHERMHRTLKEETALPPAANLGAQQDRFDHFMAEYNDDRPHASLGGDSPSDHFVPSNRTYPERLQGVEYPGHFETRAIRKDGSFRWHQKLVFVSESLRNERIGLEETEYGIWSVYFGRTLLGIFDEAAGKVYGDRRRTNH